jgi:hypothetical protein
MISNSNMKITISLIIVFAFAGSAYSQYNKGDVTVNAGLSVGLIGYGFGYYGGASGFVPLYANVEFSITPQWSVGPYIGYYGRSYSDGDLRFMALSFGGRGVFHASEFLNDKLNTSINEDKLDLYAAVHLGAEIVTWRYPDNIADGFYSNSTRIIVGPVIGIRYLFSPNFGAFLETGRGAFGIATLGITFKI